MLVDATAWMDLLALMLMSSLPPKDDPFTEADVLDLHRPKDISDSLIVNTSDKSSAPTVGKLDAVQQETVHSQLPISNFMEPFNVQHYKYEGFLRLF